MPSRLHGQLNRESAGSRSHTPAITSAEEALLQNFQPYFLRSFVAEAPSSLQERSPLTLHGLQPLKPQESSRMSPASLTLPREQPEMSLFSCSPEIVNETEITSLQQPHNCRALAAKAGASGVVGSQTQPSLLSKIHPSLSKPIFRIALFFRAHTFSAPAWHKEREVSHSLPRRSHSVPCTVSEL